MFANSNPLLRVPTLFLPARMSAVAHRGVPGWVARSLLLVGSLLVGAVQAAEPGMVFPGGEGLGKGQHIVFVTGEEYYRSEEGMSQFAKILSHRERQQPSVTTVPPLPARGPPRQGLLELS